MLEIKLCSQGFYQVLKEIREYLELGLANKSKKVKNQMIQKGLGCRSSFKRNDSIRRIYSNRT